MKSPVLSVLFCTMLALGMVVAQDSSTDSALGIYHSPLPCQPGDLFPVYIRVPEEAADCSLVFSSNLNGSRRFKGFEVSEMPGFWVVITAFGSQTKVEPHQMRITVRLQSGKTLVRQGTIAMAQRDFLSETIALDEGNTAIRTEADSRKTEQLKRLVAVLAGFDGTAPLNPGLMLRPVDSERKTSFYGDRRVYLYANGKKDYADHKGIDYGAPKGQIVRAGLRARVVLAENRITTGNTIVLEFGPGLYAQYYHLDRLDCKLGDLVDGLTPIGTVGATGLATGPHLHFELQCQGVAFDPLPLFDKAILDINQAYKILFPVR